MISGGMPFRRGDVLLGHVAEGPVNLAEVCQLVGGGRKADAPADGDQLLLVAVPADRNLVVDLFHCDHVSDLSQFRA